MMQIIWVNAPAIVEVDIPDDTPVDERYRVAVELFENNPRLHVVRSNQCGCECAIADPNDCEVRV